jgi:hypothetical protein
MRKLPQARTVFQTVRYARVFVDDLEQVVAMFASHDLEVEIISADHAFDSVDELRQFAGPTIKQVWIGARARDSSTLVGSFSVGPDGARLTIEDTTKLPGTSAELQSFVVGTAYDPWWVRPVVWLTTGWVLWSAAYWSNRTHMPLAAPVFYACIAAMVAGLLLLFFRDRLVGLVMRRAHEGGFVKRNRDGIVIGLILLVAGWLANELSRK